MSHTASQWLYFPEQWDPESPWHDQRVRQAANFGLDRDNINQAIQLGHALLYDNAFVPAHFESFDKAPPPPPFDAAKGGSCWRKRGIRAASMPGRSVATRRSRISARRWRGFALQDAAAGPRNRAEASR